MKLLPIDYTARRYEKEAVERLPSWFRRHLRILAVAPTGSGKTVIAAALVAKLHKARILWVAHRIELLRQAIEQLVVAGVPRGDIGLLSGTESYNTNARVLVASVFMFINQKAPKVDFLVVDEAHHIAANTYRKILAANETTHTLGLTATPWRLDNKPLGDAFNEMFIVAEAAELIAEGWLVRTFVYGISEEKATKLAAALGETHGADYSPKKLQAVMRKRPLMANIVSEWLRLANGVPTICYACTLDHAMDIVKRFRVAGVAAEYLDGETEAEEREAILARLRSGETKVVVNFMLLTEGLDIPAVKCIIIARPTKSLSLYMQMCGRAARPHGDSHSVVLDHVGNCWRFGLPDIPRLWSLTQRPKRSGEAPVKRCPAIIDGHECGNMDLISAKNCSLCGNEYPLSERELKEQEAELEQIRARQEEMVAVRARLEKVARDKGAPKSWVDEVLRMIFNEAT